MNIKSDQHSRNAFLRFAESVISGPKCSITGHVGFGDTVGGGAIEVEVSNSTTSTAPVAKTEDGGDPDPEPERSRPRGRPRSADNPSHGDIPPALANFDRLPDAAFVRLPVVTGILGCSKATVWRRCKLGELPSPVKLSAGTTAWRVSDIRAHLATVGC
ncbi:helix-turn-helix transcriptional regulator [Azonexus sp. IMCC34842]|uniref:helix-turn-helix transcriptional regulator n=1 Tax=Azonexus sp. IMCC34842 TaxID=3420950 RepID=UPI003D0A05C6